MKCPHKCETSSSASGGFSFSSSWLTSSFSAQLWLCQMDTETATNLTPLSLSVSLCHSWLRSCSWWMRISVPSVAWEGKGKMQTSPSQKAQRWASITWPLCQRPPFWSCPHTLFERDPYPDTHQPPLTSSTWPLWGHIPVLRTQRPLRWEQHGSQNKERAVFAPHPWK